MDVKNRSELFVFCRGGETDIVFGCNKGQMHVISAEIYKPLTMNMQWRNGTQDFKFCVLPGDDFGNWWKKIVAENQNGSDKQLKVNMEVRYYTNEDPEEFG